MLYWKIAMAHIRSIIVVFGDSWSLCAGHDHQFDNMDGVHTWICSRALWTPSLDPNAGRTDNTGRQPHGFWSVCFAAQRIDRFLVSYRTLNACASARNIDNGCSGNIGTFIRHATDSGAQSIHIYNSAASWHNLSSFYCLMNRPGHAIRRQNFRCKRNLFEHVFVCVQC